MQPGSEVNSYPFDLCVMDAGATTVANQYSNV